VQFARLVKRGAGRVGENSGEAVKRSKRRLRRGTRVWETPCFLERGSSTRGTQIKVRLQNGGKKGKKGGGGSTYNLEKKNREKRIWQKGGTKNNNVGIGGFDVGVAYLFATRGPKGGGRGGGDLGGNGGIRGGRGKRLERQAEDLGKGTRLVAKQKRGGGKKKERKHAGEKGTYVT